MGKDIKGKQLGKGISQRQDGLYTARYTNKRGKRVQKYFKKLQDCRNWLAEAQYADEHMDVLYGSEPIVDAWFEYWIEKVKGNNVRNKTKKDYITRYRMNIKPVIGCMLLKDVKTMHCQEILNRMSETYSASTINITRMVLGMIFGSAVENQLILKDPLTAGTKSKSRKKKKEVRVLTVTEQKTFLESIKACAYYNQFAFILQTGLREGELTGLKWTDVDFDEKVIHIRSTMNFEGHFGWRAGEPKTETSVRDVPLTQEAVAILKNQLEKQKMLKVFSIEFADIVFFSKNGRPIHSNAYDYALGEYCKKSGTKHFSMHSLRHTFATRCFEAGMRPKTLQKILGHKKIETTMNLYVHVMEKEKVKDLENVEKMLKLV